MLESEQVFHMRPWLADTGLCHGSLSGAEVGRQPSLLQFSVGIPLCTACVAERVTQNKHTEIYQSQKCEIDKRLTSCRMHRNRRSYTRLISRWQPDYFCSDSGCCRKVVAREASWFYGRHTSTWPLLVSTQYVLYLQLRRVR